MATLVRTQISLTPEHMARLRELAAERDTPIAQLVREAVEQLIGEADRRERMLHALHAASSRPLGDRDGRTDVAEHHDEFLTGRW